MSYQVTRKSPYTGNLNTIELPLTAEQFEAAFVRWKKGELVQNAFPTLTPDQREFLMTGYTKEDWDKMFGRGFSRQSW
jgi:hypothetical protein